MSDKKMIDQLQAKIKRYEMGMRYAAECLEDLSTRGGGTGLTARNAQKALEGVCGKPCACCLGLGGINDSVCFCDEIEEVK